MPPWAIPTTTSKAWACLRTSTFAHRSDDRTTTAHANLMAPRRCIVVWPVHLVSQRIAAWQSTRPKRLKAVCSFVHCEAALSLQAAYSDPVEDTLIVLRPGPKVVFQYELRFVNRLKSQLLISHLFLPIKQMPPKEKEETRNQAAFGKYPHFFELSDQFLFQCEKPSAHDRGGCLVQRRFRSRLTGYSQQQQ